MNYLGIDVSKSTSRCVILNNDGERFTEAFTLHNNNHDFNKLLAKLKQLNLNYENILIGIEATGVWWENLYNTAGTSFLSVASAWPWWSSSAASAAGREGWAGFSLNMAIPSTLSIFPSSSFSLMP